MGNDTTRDTTEPATGPSYRAEITPLVEAVARLLIRVRSLRPDAPVGLEPPAVYVDSAGLRLSVIVPRPDGRYVLIDDLSIDPARPDFGRSNVPLIIEPARTEH
jgi:hypothetical protein